MTIEYYNHNAEAFRQRTADRDMSWLYDPFLSLLPPGAHILDAGCGPGRDSLAFLRRGFHVTAADASSAMVEMARAATGLPVLLLPFQQIDFDQAFDGIWANASLLHVPSREIDDVLRRLTRALRPGGILYMSVKLGDGERTTAEGRLFCDYTESSLRAVLAGHPALGVLEIHQTDPAPNQADGKSWLHATLRKHITPTT
ncbi:MAG TPA: class I SAM-dependent methyltransferase [Tepidisphaeraceae bacterium]|jgi:SAM-dependent methyltransferase